MTGNDYVGGPGCPLQSMESWRMGKKRGRKMGPTSSNS